MNFFFKVKKSIVGLKIPKPFECQAEGATCQRGGVRKTKSRNYTTLMIFTLQVPQRGKNVAKKAFADCGD